MNVLSERISWLPASENPLSSDVVLINGDKAEWIYDTGSCDEAFLMIQGIKREKNIIISHFHEDHMKNLNRLEYDTLYCGNYTYSKLQKGVEVLKPLVFKDGVSLRIIPIPSTHSPGALVLEVDEKYAFIGDAVYAAARRGSPAFNVNKLKEMIEVLEKLKADKFMISHNSEYVQDKEKILDQLRALYRLKKPGEAFIFIEKMIAEI